MKSYLDLIKISARQRRKQNLMTRLCIVLAVFLVTVIFGMADMEMRSQLLQAKQTDGSWHAVFHIPEEQGALLSARPEIKRMARYGTLNYYLRDGYQLQGVETGICGFDVEFQDLIPDAKVFEGSFPRTAQEAVINENIRARLGIQIGDFLDLTTPQGERKQYLVTGITKNTALMAEKDAFCMFLNMEGFQELHGEDTDAAQEMLYYVEFRQFCNIPRVLEDIREQFELAPEQVGQNAKVLMLLFQSRDTYLMKFYLVAAILAVLVVIAGILMITASMNSNLAQRTEFFGMLRCLGATRKQVIRFVRREALGWCKTAVPAGVLAGVAVVWILCGMLRYLSPGLFQGLPVLGISVPGIVAGVLVGFLTVWLASGAPAKRASRVSPLTAVSGNAGTVRGVKGTANTRIFKVDTALGIHHASGSRKNFFLVTGSFAFSIILFLAFSTAIDFMHHAITPLRPSAPDLTIQKEDNSNEIPLELVGELEQYPGVKRAFGRSYARIPLSGEEGELILLSYDEQQFQLEKGSLLEGNMRDAMEGKGALWVFRKGRIVSAGSSVTLSTGKGEQKVPIAGVLGDVPYSYGMDSSMDSMPDMVICSQALFEKITGQRGYAVLDVQLHWDTADAQVQEIRQIVEESCETQVIFSDRRIGNQETRGASYSMSLFLYGFLAVIALIGFFNMINSIAMSVSARMGEYGAMRAIGMSMDQLTRMVRGEAMTYTVFGVLFGCGLGLPLNWFLFQSLVTSRWGDAWGLPGWELLVILIILAVSVCLAIVGPARQIRKMTIVDTISKE